MSSKRLSKQQKQALNERVTALFLPLQTVQTIPVNTRDHRITMDMRQMWARDYRKRRHSMSDKTLAKLVVLAAVVGTVDIVLLFIAVLVK